MVRIILGLFLLSVVSFSDIIPRTQTLEIGGEIHHINIDRLLDLTRQIESRGGKDNYQGRYAKTSYQYELDTVQHYLSAVPELKSYVEERLGRKLNILSEKDARYITWLVYMAKLRYHKSWLNKYYTYYLETGDTEWLIYKVLWNSIKGKSTYKKWQQRNKELIAINCLTKL